jgi:hypothetical protein
MWIMTTVAVPVRSRVDSAFAALSACGATSDWERFRTARSNSGPLLNTWLPTRKEPRDRRPRGTGPAPAARGGMGARSELTAKYTTGGSPVSRHPRRLGGPRGLRALPRGGRGRGGVGSPGARGALGQRRMTPRLFTCGTRTVVAHGPFDWRAVCATCERGGRTPYRTLREAQKAAVRDSSRRCRCGAS